MKGLLFLCSLLFIYQSLHAHEVNEAFFIVKKQGNYIVVESEFPWTLRNALITFNPKLEKATGKQEFEKTFIQYIKTNLILTAPNGIPLAFAEFKEIDKSRHSHQNNFILTFIGESVAEITNTMMFNIYDNQVNYITIKLDNSESTYKTKKGKSTIKVNLKKNDGKIGYIASIVLLVIIGFILFINNYRQ